MPITLSEPVFAIVLGIGMVVITILFAVGVGWLGWDEPEGDGV